MFAIFTSLVSISWGAVLFKSGSDDTKEFHNPPRPFKFRDYVLEMIWNMLAISCRVIPLALFATRYDIAAIVIIQMIIWTIVVEAVELAIDLQNIFVTFIFHGMSFTLNLIQISFAGAGSFILSYWWYIFYWWITMAENTVMISLWSVATAELDLWYRTLVVGYVTMGYAVSFLVKSYHMRTRIHNKGKPPWEWYA